MADAISYGILGAIVASAGIFLIRELRGQAVAEPLDDLGDRESYGDWPAVPTAVSSFHDQGLMR